MIKENIRFEDSTVMEGITSLRAVIHGIQNGVNDRNIHRILIDSTKTSKLYKEIGWLTAISKKYGFTIEEVESSVIESVSLGTSHGGIVAECSARTLPRIDEMNALKNDGFYAMIDGIEDPYNFGYSIRSLYACGCDGIIVPGRNWFTAAGVVARSSAGASEMLPVFLTENSDTVPTLFHQKGYDVICAEEKTDLILGQCPLSLPILLIVGGEKRGISKRVLEQADKKIKIWYQREFRASLSAASATTMFAYEIARQNTKK